MNINFNDAPEGATHYANVINRVLFYKVEDECLCFLDEWIEDRSPIVWLINNLNKIPGE